MALYFDQNFLDELMLRNDIIEVISGYVHLERRGSKYWGRCPFHNEKTPSFSVDATKQMFYCFGCHKGGNVITFVRDAERIDFQEAVELLAERAGMELPKTQGGERVNRDGLYDTMRKAALFFHRCLYEPQGAAALQYLRGRGLNENIIKRFGIGFAPDGNVLIKYMSGEGVPFENLEKTCLAMEREGRRFDFFRGRVVFPIIDKRSRVIGFGGRVMDGSQPKYLNTPETVLYKKRDNLYGINLLVKQNQLKQALIVEGYMDVVSLNSVGMDFSVASLGTALTENQAKLIGRYTRDVVIGYDDDPAGRKGMLRGLDILRDAGLRVRVATFTDGMDPDDFARSRGVAGVTAVIENAKPLNDYVIDITAQKYDLTKTEQRTYFVEEICTELLCKLKNAVEYDVYSKQVAQICGVSKNAIDEETIKAGREGQSPQRYNEEPIKLTYNKAEPAAKNDAVSKAIDILINEAISKHSMDPRIIEALRQEEISEAQKEILDSYCWENNKEKEISLLSEKAMSELARIRMNEALQGGEKQTLIADCLYIIEKNRIEKRIIEINDEIRLHGADENTRRALLSEQNELIRKKAGLRKNK